MMSSPKLRNMACALAPIDVEKAAEYARRIDDPWYACQAFAWCGRYAPRADSESFIDQAFAQAEAGKDAYQRVAATAWPLRALVELGQMARAAQEFDRIAPLASHIEPPSSRSEACFEVYEALAIGYKELAGKALHWLLSESQPVEHWRQKRNIRDAVIHAISLYTFAPEDVLPLVRDEKLKSKLAQRLSQGEVAWPRPFFWLHRYLSIDAFAADPEMVDILKSYLSSL